MMPNSVGASRPGSNVRYSVSYAASDPHGAMIWAFARGVPHGAPHDVYSRGGDAGGATEVLSASANEAITSAALVRNAAAPRRDDHRPAVIAWGWTPDRTSAD